ncbi:LLM class flavin-dependent oxidoreductase [Kribbella shirazensis]|uniref:Alkanesulfonate monooxygenase SsuD/methylene tetrahydromethanopterin reductase-like flavin-dependent oxidoreductase (Luciferase family) n=1 Tax=Kribbella shirazensis TaxID=1105143 RepID=A0A7X5VFQ5_9ACTN|nr:LLM class flavin-dependent oxidoreductase [Kribbella shirazensis]NIK59438.1 alkanesulfonate monooxygenase SsuD/methylene tetrahydromethanopterin reductase-like flavin-dependent oxidoreductase (luciferase family) [Kribbella shirazensis]
MVELQVVLPDESATMPPERLVELAIAAEDLGYGTAWLPDHLLPPGEFGPTYGGVYEPLVTIGYLAARTSRIRFGTSVLVLPLRSPYVVAKQAATLHRLSGERVVLGIGAGWARDEFAAVGAVFEERGRRTDEALGIVRDLFEGRDRGGVFEPTPRAPLPIMIGGTTVPALRRAARYGDEWQGLNLDGAGFAAAVSRLRSFGDRPIKVGTRLVWSAGEPGPVIEQARELVDAGAETLAVSFGDESSALDRMTKFRDLFTAG